MLMTILYLVAIVIANVAVSILGPWASVWCAFFLVGFVMTSRDRLHEEWAGKHLKRNMFLLIATGSLISLALGAGQIAIASFVAFAASESLDALVYWYNRKHHGRFYSSNVSNLASSAVDSILFPLIAFGLPLLIPIVIGQFLAKVVGGYLWSRLLVRDK